VNKPGRVQAAEKFILVPAAAEGRVSLAAIPAQETGFLLALTPEQIVYF